MRGASRLPTYVGRVLVVVGFLMILVAWNGAAELDFIQGQFPFLLSGAIPGLAFIIIGAGLEYVQTMREFTAQRARQMAEINVSVLKLIAYVKETGGLIPGPDDDQRAHLEAQERARPVTLDRGGVALEAPPAPRPSPTAGAAAAAGTAVAERGDEPRQRAAAEDDMVVAGRSSFHDPECHLVAGRDDMATITRLEAQGQGLAPCRVCKP